MSRRGMPLLVFAGLLALPTSVLASQLVLDLDRSPYVMVQLGGATLRLKVELDQEEGVTLNAAAAARAGLGRGTGGTEMLIGPVALKGRKVTQPLLIDGQSVEASLRWYERDVVAGADGVISPALLPYESVTLQRGRGSGSEREIVLQAKFNEDHGVHVPVRMGGRTVAVRFSLDRPRTVAMAATVAILSRQLGGSLERGTQREEIGFGVKRPVMTFRPAQPLRVGGFTIPVLMARAFDFRGDHKLPPTTAAASDDSIVVVGEARSQDAVRRMTVGGDVLQSCSSVTYRRQAGTLVFRCSGN